MTTPIPLGQQPEFNGVYLTTCGSLADSTLVWGSTLDMAGVESFLASERKVGGLLTSPIHLLIRAVVLTLQTHPEFNRRVRGKSIVPLSRIHVLVPCRISRNGEIKVISIPAADEMSLREIAQAMWQGLHALAADDRAERNQVRSLWRRFQRNLYLRLAPTAMWLTNRLNLSFLPYTELLHTPSVHVNHLQFAQNPPMIFFKPTTLPMNAAPLYVALGTSSPQVVAHEGVPTVRNIAPLIVKADHRIVDTSRLAQFVATLRTLMSDPATMLSGCTRAAPSAETLESLA